MIVVGVMLVAAIGIAAGSLITGQRAVVVDETEQAASTLARVLVEQTSNSMQAVDLTLREVVGRLASAEASNPDAPAKPVNTKATFDLLTDKLKGLPQADAILVVGVDGMLQSNSRGFPTAILDLKDREYFSHFIDKDDHGVFVSVAFKSHMSGLWTVYFSRRINGPHDEFRGVVAAAVTLSFFENFYKAVTPAFVAVTLLRRDGTILVRYPPDEHIIGLKLPPIAPWYQCLGEGGGSYRSPGYVDGRPSLVAVRPMRDFPLVIDASTTEAAALTGWRRHALWILSGAAVAAAGVILLLWAFSKQFGRLERSEASLAQQNAQLENGRLQFAAVLENIHQGVTFFDGDQQLMVCNRRYAEIYRLSDNLTLPGTSLADILTYRVARGSFPDMTIANYLARRATLCEPRQAFFVTDEFCDGRAVSMQYQSLPNGGWVTTHEDITERRGAEATLAFMARHDSLTGLPNRTLFQERLGEAIAASRNGTQCALMCLDLDRFKVINDTLGHPAGDGLLRAVAERLTDTVRGIDTVARLGGDEFAIVQVGLKSREHAAGLADRILTALSKPYEIDGNRIIAAASLGIAMAPSDGSSSEMLLKSADIALYLAKAEGRGTYRFFEAKVDSRVRELRVVELDLRNALPADDFELYYQPILDLESGAVAGFEALIRWNHPDRGLISPADFIPIAEETGLIIPIGEWVVRTACREAANWPEHIDIAVNLSPAQFKSSHLLDCVHAALADSGLAPKRLVFEITETVLLQHNDSGLALLHQFRALGIRIALDDFGTGYSSLSYLHSFPFDKIKIDRSFIHDVDTNKESKVIVGAILGLARSLDMTTVAEGVETAQQLAMLRDQGCTKVQGFLFSRPAPASQVDALIRTLRIPDQSDPDAGNIASQARTREVVASHG